MDTTHIKRQGQGSKIHVFCKLEYTVFLALLIEMCMPKHTSQCIILATLQHSPLAGNINLTEEHGQDNE